MTRSLGVAALAVALCAAGCAPSTEEQYKVLSFFFDGVPEPGEAAPEKRISAAQKVEAPKKATIYQHGPYAAKDCGACHLPHTNGLRAPLNELCLYCHDLRLAKQYVHEPVTSGDCRSCHHPHRSRYRYMLVSSMTTLCGTCHDVGQKEQYGHEPVTSGECQSCHNAHGSANRAMLVTPPGKLCGTCHDLGSAKKFVHEPVSSGGCQSCHGPHGSANRAMLVSPPATLCVSCHDRGSGDQHEGVDDCLDCHAAHMSDDEHLLN